ncbi:hypothetical protein CBL_20302 [Carabus blaptoides fortunei]
MLNKTTRRTELRAESDTVKMLFWNVVGMKVKDKEFWESIKGLDVNGLTETWIEKKQWNQIKEKLPNEYTCKSKHAKRIHKKGRAMGGILTGIKKNIEEIEIQETVTEELQERKIKLDNEIWSIITIYNNGKMIEMKNQLADYEGST